MTETLPGIPAVVYAAKSTEDVAGSIATQLEEIAATLEREGGRFVYGEPQSDERFSGYTGSRGPGLAEAIRLAEEAAVEHRKAELWAVDADRFARGDGRRARHLGGLYFDLLEVGVSLRTVTGDDDMGDPIRVVLRGERSRQDSESKSAHVRRGKRRQFERGQHLGGPIPDGYAAVVKLDASGRPSTAREIDPTRAPVWRRVFELAEGGMADANIARRLHAEGHRTKTGGHITRRRVQDVLTNPYYAGRVARNRTKAGEPLEWTEGSHAALVAPEVFDRIQAGRVHRDRARGSDRRPGRPNSRHALAGLAYCSRCGEKMRPRVSTYKRVDGTQARQYVCQHYHDSTGLCDQPAIDAEVVDRAVVAHLRSFFVDFDGWLAAVGDHDKAAREGIERSLAAERERLETGKRREDKVRERWLGAMDAGDEKLEARAYEALQALAEERDQVRHRVSELERAATTLTEESPTDALLDHYNRLSAAVSGRLDAAETLAEVNAELRDLFDLFVLDMTDKGIVAIPVLRPDDARFMVLDSRKGEPPETEDPDDWARFYDANPPEWGSLYGTGDTNPESFPTLITGAERIVPPVRPVEMPSSEPTNTWEPWHYGYLHNAGTASVGFGGKTGDGRSALPSYVPTRFRPTLARAAQRWNVSAGLLAAQIYAESNFNPFAVSPAGARGIAQFMPGTARAFGLDDPFDAAASIDAQARMMRDLLRRFSSVPLALAAYNAGPGAVAGCGCIPPFPETRAYVAKILGLLGGVGEIAGAGELGVHLVE